MKRIIFIFLFAIIAIITNAQIINRVNAYNCKRASSESSAPETLSDNFNSYSAGTNIAGNNNWISGVGTITSNGTQVYPNSNDNIIVYRSETVTANQFAQMTLPFASSSRYLGPAVRCSNTGCYALVAIGDNIACIKVVNGVLTTLGYYTGPITGVDLKIEISGYTISCYTNGVLDTNLGGGDGQFEDTDLTSGHVGIYGLNASEMRIGDDWLGGSL